MKHVVVALLLTRKSTRRTLHQVLAQTLMTSLIPGIYLPSQQFLVGWQHLPTWKKCSDISGTCNRHTDLFWDHSLISCSYQILNASLARFNTHFCLISITEICLESLLSLLYFIILLPLPSEEQSEEKIRIPHGLACLNWQLIMDMNCQWRIPHGLMCMDWLVFNCPWWSSQ